MFHKIDVFQPNVSRNSQFQQCLKTVGISRIFGAGSRQKKKGSEFSLNGLVQKIYKLSRGWLCKVYGHLCVGIRGSRWICDCTGAYAADRAFFCFDNGTMRDNGTARNEYPFHVPNGHRYRPIFFWNYGWRPGCLDGHNACHCVLLACVVYLFCHHSLYDVIGKQRGWQPSPRGRDDSSLRYSDLRWSEYCHLHRNQAVCSYLQFPIDVGPGRYRFFGIKSRWHAQRLHERRHCVFRANTRDDTFGECYPFLCFPHDYNEIYRIRLRNWSEIRYSWTPYYNVTDFVHVSCF